jgi:hypothetical protein
MTELAFRKFTEDVVTENMNVITPYEGKALQILNSLVKRGQRITKTNSKTKCDRSAALPSTKTKLRTTHFPV